MTPLFALSFLVFISTGHASEETWGEKERSYCPSSIAIMGHLKCSDLMEYTNRHHRQFAHCHKKAAGAPSKGGFQMNFSIASDGSVAEASVDSRFNTLKAKAVEECVLALVKKMHFPAHADRQAVEVILPFSFPFEKWKRKANEAR